MEKKLPFQVSKEIIEIPNVYENLGISLVNDFYQKNQQAAFVEIDCAPNGELNVFKVGNGLDSAKAILGVVGSFYGKEKDWLEKMTQNTNSSDWKPDYSIGEKLGIWKRIERNNYQQLLDWNRPFCIKNTKGLNRIWHPEWRLFSKIGFNTRKSIIDFIFDGEVYLQPFFVPLTAINTPDWHMIYRLVFLMNGNEKIEFIGGLWISRPGFRVYPDKTAVVGLISNKKF